MKNVLFSFFVPLLLLATFILPQSAPAQTVSDTKTVVQSADSVTDATLETAYSEAIGGDDAGYHFRRNGSGYTAYNAAHNLTMDATPETVTFSFSDDTWQLASDVPATQTTIRENRLTIQRDGYEEWYINGPLGLQQGFTLHEPAAISFDLGGTLSTTASRQTLHLGDKLTFAGLIAYDANGQSVPVEFKAEDNRLVYAYDDTAATYPLTIDPWLQQAKLLASDGARMDLFGHAVALDGDTAIVGAPFDDANKTENSGSAYVFVRSGTTWSQQAKLSPAAGIFEGNFGWSVALDGDTALIGGTFEDKVYVFVRSGTTWTQQAELKTSEINHGWFGWSVAISGDTALVGSWSGACNPPDPSKSCGRAYVFTRSGTIWTQQAKLSTGSSDDSDSFGSSVALEGDTALVGYPAMFDEYGSIVGSGTVHVFVRGGTTWTQQAKLSPADGETGDHFGHSISISGDSTLVGTVSGSAYVFVRSGTTWSQQAKLTASDGNLGPTVALDGDRALVGAYSNESAYVFARSGTTWSQQQKLTANDVADERWFGETVALDGDTAVVGARWDKENDWLAGTAYIFSLALNQSLTASAVCNGPDLDVTISAGDGPFDITASAGVNTPVTGTSVGTTTITGPEKWDDVTVSESIGDTESINLGQFKCRTDERPVPVYPAHRSRITASYPVFSWTGISNANNYRVFLFDDASAATRTVDIRQNSGGPTTMTINTALPDGRLFWRVRGRQNRVWSLWSVRFTLFKDPVASFSATTPMPTLELAPPNNPPTLVPLPTTAPGDDPTLPTQVPFPTTAPENPTLPAPPNSR